VIDLARDHILALNILDKKSAIYNLGCGGEGYSVREVIDIAREITGKQIPLKVGPRRVGDPAVLIASSKEIKRDLGWSPRFGDLRLIIESAWTLMQRKEIERALSAEAFSGSKA